MKALATQQLQIRQDNTTNKIKYPATGIRDPCYYCKETSLFIKCLTSFSAKASTTESAAMATVEPFSLANSSTVALTHTWPLEPVTLRLAYPSFCRPQPHF